jgi:hypothetical protein
MANLEALQTHAKERGYKLTVGKGGSYVGNYSGIEFEDDDPQRLCDDMDSVVEIAKSEEYELLDEADEDGQSIVQVSIDGDTRQFINISVAAALSEAKEAVLASKPKPSTGPRRARRTAVAAESMNEAEEAAVHTAPPPPPPPTTQASAAWDKEMADQKARVQEAEILPPEGGERLTALRIDLRAFQQVVRDLAGVVTKLRDIIDNAADATPEDTEEEEEAPKRGRGRPRRNSGR